MDVGKGEIVFCISYYPIVGEEYILQTLQAFRRKSLLLQFKILFINLTVICRLVLQL